MAGGQGTGAAAPKAGPSDAEGADGSRTVGLYLPFTSAGIERTHIRFTPFTFGHLTRWQSGRFGSAFELMMELAGWKLHELERLSRPDYPRVMAAFLDHVDPEVAADIGGGRRPLLTDAVYATPSMVAGASGGPQAAAAPSPVQEYPSGDEGGQGPVSGDPFSGVDGDARPIDWDPRVDD